MYILRFHNLEKERFIQSLFHFDQYRIYLTFFQIFKTLHKAIKINQICISGSKETSRDSSLWRKTRGEKEREREDEVSFDAGCRLEKLVAFPTVESNSCHPFPTPSIPRNYSHEYDNRWRRANISAGNLFFPGRERTEAEAFWRVIRLNVDYLTACSFFFILLRFVPWKRVFLAELLRNEFLFPSLELFNHRAPLFFVPLFAAR